MVFLKSSRAKSCKYDKKNNHEKSKVVNAKEMNFKVMTNSLERANLIF